LKEIDEEMRKKRSLSLLSMIFGRRQHHISKDSTAGGIGDASVHHALVVIFLEYFSWGLLTVPVINVSIFNNIS
jgi:hypothetical protein